MIYRLPKGTHDDITAVYRARGDGDWDFVAMLAADPTFPLLSQADDDQAVSMIECLACAIEEEGDDVLIVYHNEPDLPSVYEYKP